MKITYNKKRIELPVKKSLGIRGLMFRRRDDTPALVLQNIGTLHSFFVFFPFIVLWLNDENNVVDIKIARPFQLSIKSKKKYNKIIEIPINEQLSDICYSLGSSRREKGLKT